MTDKPVATFRLTDRLSGEPVDAVLWHPVLDRHADDFEQRWRPVFDEWIDKIRSSGADINEAIALHRIQDAHWEWAKKANEIKGRLDWDSFALEAGGITQGLMFVQTAGFAREPSQVGLPLVEIALLATAPWNRASLVAVPQFKGIGQLLLAAAISLSVHEEFAGRIGLHALPQAEGWYRDNCGMCDLGVDSSEMRYFEMTSEQAKAFLER